jgi:RNA polymerase sigma-70 factor (ECF subfamily)
MAIDLEATYQRYAPMVMRRCRRLLGDEELALDALQDTFVRLVEHGEVLEDRGLSALLYRMATQVSLNHLRSARRRPTVPDGELVWRVACATATDEDRAGARQLLDRLFARHPTSTGTLAVLHLVDGLALEEVASLVELSVSGVRKRLRRLREELRELEGSV